MAAEEGGRGAAMPRRNEERPGRRPVAVVENTASPGTFCDAIVTMKSGRAMLTSAPGENAGMHEDRLRPDRQERRRRQAAWRAR